MKDRGMKKWLPYKSLTEQGGYLEEMIARKSIEERPVPLEGQSERIDAFLRSYLGGEIDLRYYASGHVHHYKGTPEKIDFRKKTIDFPLFSIPFMDIVEIISEEDFNISQ